VTALDPDSPKRDALGRWLFDRDYRDRGLASPEDADWRSFVERKREEWREEADALLAFLAAREQARAAELERQKQERLAKARSRSYGRGTCTGCHTVRGLLSNGRPWPHDLPGGATRPNGARICPGCSQPALPLVAQQ
jgi:hypothetical protein